MRKDRIGRYAAVAVMILFSLLNVAARNISGSWRGKLQLAPQASLRLVIHISGDEGAETVKLDSPDQGALGLPGRVDFCSPDSLAISLPMLGAQYSGKLIDGKLQGSFSQRGFKTGLILEPGAVEYSRPQTPKPPFPYTTKELEIRNPQDASVVLSATLTLPAGANESTPVVVMVSGSGQQNRDEEILGHKPFAVIADALARNGIASVRYDDRGYGLSKGSLRGATTRDFTEDAISVAEHIKGSQKLGKVGILGHSEGGRIALAIAAGSKPHADFIIGIGTPGVRGDSLLVSQNEIALRAGGVPADLVSRYCDALYRMLGALSRGDKNEMERIAAEESAFGANNFVYKGLADNLKKMINSGEEESWLRYFVSDSPAKDIAKTSCPALMLFGERDTQVAPDFNIAPFESLNPGIKVKKYPELNHLMQHCKSGLFNEYGNIEETISTEVLTDIIDFIRSLSK